MGELLMLVEALSLGSTILLRHSWNMPAKHGWLMDFERSPRFTMANRVASETATSETSIPYREVEDAEELKGDAKDADTHLRMHEYVSIYLNSYKCVYT